MCCACFRSVTGQRIRTAQARGVDGAALAVDRPSNTTADPSPESGNPDPIKGKWVPDREAACRMLPGFATGWRHLAGKRVVAKGDTQVAAPSENSHRLRSAATAGQ